MVTTWVMVLTIVILIAIFLSLPITMKIYLNADNKAIDVKIHLYVTGILLFRYRKKNEFQQSPHHEIPDPSQKHSRPQQSSPFFHLLPIIDHLLRLLTIKKWNWNIELGVDDAALTGILTGFVYGLAGILNQYLLTKIRFLSLPTTIVTPHFNELTMRANLHCIVKSRLGKAIYAAIRIFILLHRRGAHGGSSNPIADVHHA